MSKTEFAIIWGVVIAAAVAFAIITQVGHDGEHGRPSHAPKPAVSATR